MVKYLTAFEYTKLCGLESNIARYYGWKLTEYCFKRGIIVRTKMTKTGLVNTYPVEILKIVIGGKDDKQRL